MQVRLTLILSIFLSQIWLPGVLASSSNVDCDMPCCAPKVQTSCCESSAAPRPEGMHSELRCGCATDSPQPEPATPAPQTRDSRVDLQAPLGGGTSAIVLRMTANLTPSHQRWGLVIPTHNTVQALKGIWRT